jgi:hypothetical protein
MEELEIAPARLAALLQGVVPCFEPHLARAYGDGLRLATRGGAGGGVAHEELHIKELVPLLSGSGEGRWLALHTLRAMQIAAEHDDAAAAVLLDALGLFGTTAGLVLIYSTSSVPFSIWMLKGYFDTIPRDLDESARLDGASSWVVFWHILLPLVRPGIGITALFSFMTAWSEYIVAAQVMQDESMFTLPLGIKGFQASLSSQWGLYAAASILVSIPVVAVFLAFSKYLVNGLTVGSVKE